MRPHPLLSILFVLICTPLHAEVKLHTLFGRQTVLQTRSAIRLHGSADPDPQAVVRCSWEQNDRTAIVKKDGTRSIPIDYSTSLQK